MKKFAVVLIAEYTMAESYGLRGAPCRFRNPNRVEPRVKKALEHIEVIPD